MDALPSGLITFLFTDVEGSTRLFERHAEGMTAALARHHDILRTAIEAHRGHIFQIVGDGLCAAFSDVQDAVAAALAAQHELFVETWPSIGALRVRMGLHTGMAEARDGDYVSSLTLARAQRVAAAGHGGQTLVSKATADALRNALPPAVTLRDLGAYKLRGIAEAENIHQLVSAGVPSDFPPLQVEQASTASASPLGDLVRGALVGRDAESRQLQAHWAAAHQARGQFVLLSGEPGVGKTRLCHELVAHTRRDGAVVLRGGCYEYEATTPYLPFVEAIRDWAHRQSPAQLRDALGASAAVIAKFAPEIAERLGPPAMNPSLPPADERLRLFDHTARFIAALAGDSGLLLFIDDLHWADQGTLSLLHYLLRHLRNDRVLVLSAYREVELDRAHPLAAALVEWNRERLVTRVQLARLSRQAMAKMLAAMFGQDRISDEFSEALYRETEGNPFFAEEVIKSLVEQGDIYREGDRWQRKETRELALPQSVKEAIGRRLNRLDERTVDVLRTAAALGKRFRFRELAAVTSIDEDALLDALDDATAAELIRVDLEIAKAAGGDGFAFTHDKIREVLNSEANPIRRRRLHQRIGEALEALYDVTPDSIPGNDDHAQDLAHHFMQSGDLARSLAYARRAARDAKRVFAHDEALKYLDQARESADAQKLIDVVAAVDEEAGDILQVRGTTAPAVARYEQALAATTDGARRAAIKAKIGNAYCAVGDPRSMRFLDEALAELDPVRQTSELALATALIGRIYHYRTEHRRALQFLERAHALAEPLGDPFTLATIQSYLAGAHQHLLEFAASDGWARANVAFGERTGLAFAKASGFEFLSENASNRGLWKDGVVYARKDEAEAARTGELARKGWSHFCLAQALHGTGDLDNARQFAASSLSLADKLGEYRLAAWAGTVLVCALADLAHDDEARRTADESSTRARNLGQLLLSAWALHAQGYAALRRGDIATAIASYEQYAALVRDTENGVSKLLVMPDCADALACAGRGDEAWALAKTAISVAEFAVAPHRRAIAQRAQARVLVLRGERAAARALLDEAIATLEATDSQLERGRTLVVRSELTKAADDLALARKLFEACGAVRDLQQVNQLLEESA